MTIADAAAVARQPADNRQMINAIIASMLGWALDLFDLFILLYVAPVLGALFFPSNNTTLSLAAVYASFAVTLLMRPVGSAVFGHYADIHGRKGAMLTAVVGVGVATAAFGLLPTIAQAGVAAPILFLFLRLIQGVHPAAPGAFPPSAPVPRLPSFPARQTTPHLSASAYRAIAERPPGRPRFELLCRDSGGHELRMEVAGSPLPKAWDR